MFTTIRRLSPALLLALSVSVFGADFKLTRLPIFPTSIDLAEHQGETFYDLMQSDLRELMNGRRSSTDNDTLLKSGKGVAVKLNDSNYNVHVNYFDSPQSGRSYGWSQGLVGDWSDKAILTNLTEVAQGTDEELVEFYTTLVQMVGNCDASHLSNLQGMAERVAVNFLAIYAAEEYRATLGSKNWDDALFEATMLAAFHGGQRKFTKFYMGEFSSRSFKQAPGVYNARGPINVKPAANTAKAADMTDYWQFSANPEKRNSGINLTRPDFEKMGQVITAFEKNNKHVRAIEAIVKGSGKNVIKDVTRYFALGKAQASDTDELAAHVAALMVQIRDDAEAITASAKSE